MASKAFHIELRVSNVDDPERLKAVRQAVQTAGQELHAAVVLICGEQTEPEIVLYGEDFREGKVEMPLHEEDL